MHPHHTLSRRELLRRSGFGLGALGLSPLLAQASSASTTTSGHVQPHHFPRAKYVIHLFMNGGPSQVDTFDPKPELARWDGKELPLEEGNFRTERKTGAALASPFSFKNYGQSGLPVSELFPLTAQHADELCVVRSMQADVPNHEPSLMLMNCGHSRELRPSVGSWLTYGLGSENENLPGYVAMCPGGKPIKEAKNWQAGFLPGNYQGTYIDPKQRQVDQLIPHLTRHDHLDPQIQKAQFDLLHQLDQTHLAARQNDASLEARIRSFELAYRMQSEATDAFDVDREPQHIRQLYGDSDFSRQCLIARRLVERGTRFVQLWYGAGQPWDDHEEILNHRNHAQNCDQGIAALLTDLKRRGLLEDTLVLWGGEFGRTPVVELPMPGQARKQLHGRDHNHYGFTIWMAGGGVKGGHVYGATDEFGFRAVENPVHVHDLHATLLHLLGYDHQRFTYHYGGRDHRLTDVHGHVIHDLIA